MNIDKLFSALMFSSAFIFATACVGLIIFLFMQSGDFLQTGFVEKSVSGQSWYPTQQQYGLLPLIVGTFCCAILACLICVPLSFLLAVYLLFYSPHAVRRLGKHLLDILAGMPSVLYGLWGLTVIVPLLTQYLGTGSSLLAGGICLACMLLPMFTLLLLESLQTFDQHWGSYCTSLGLSKETALLLIYPTTARDALFSGLLLLCGRAVGETMILVMVCGNIPQLPQSLLDPVRTLSATIALEMSYAMQEHRQALFYCAFVLLCSSLVLSLLSHKLAPRVEQ